MGDAPTWYIVKSESGNCQIVSSSDLNRVNAQETWGPFTSQQEAIARRVGLIRAGKCQPT